MTTLPPLRSATPARSPSIRRSRPPGWIALGVVAWAASGSAAAARPGGETNAPTCYRTAGGALEICRDGSEAEGVLAAPPACSFARGVQLVRLSRAGLPGPIQAVFQGESPQSGRRRGEDCSGRKATDPRDGGTLRTGRNPEQLATILPPSEMRFGVSLPEQQGRRRRDEGTAPAVEGIGPRAPITISGRDWAGEEYSYVFMLGQEPVAAPSEEPPRGSRRGQSQAEGEGGERKGGEGLRRRVQIEARTLDFVSFEIRTRDGEGTSWTPAESDKGKRRSAPTPATVLDVDGKPIASSCPAAPFDTQGLAGSISISERTYHYFYTDVLPEDCGLAPEKRRTGLYLRTATDLAADRVWSAPRRLGGPLPPGTLARVARSKDGSRWAMSYTCYRPANAPGGPVADICLQYTADLDPAGLGALTLYAEPLEAARSPAYLGLRSGGDGAGRFDRSAHFWMTDAYGNLDVPSTFAGKSGLLTWVDRLAPGAGGIQGSTVYGRPVYWGTWTVRRTGTP